MLTTNAMQVDSVMLMTVSWQADKSSQHVLEVIVGMQQLGAKMLDYVLQVMFIDY